MTREEAIQILSTRDAHGVLCGYTSGVTEALDMAIEALSVETVHRWMTGKPTENSKYMVTLDAWGRRYIALMHYGEPLKIMAMRAMA